MARKKQIDYMNVWQKQKCRRFVLSLNRETQGEVIEFMEKNRPVQSYIIRLIKEDIARSKAEQK